MDRLRAVASRFRRLQKNIKEDEENENSEQYKGVLIELLTLICEIVKRGGHNASLEETADDLINLMVSFAYGGDIEIDFLESFAHCQSGLLQDPAFNGVMSSYGASAFAAQTALLTRIADDPARLASIPGFTRETYYEIERPHEKTSPMARLRPGISHSAVSEATPSALAVFQARLSMYGTQTYMPIRLSIPPDSSCLALLQCGGYKNRDPIFSVYFCDVESEYKFAKEANIESGLLEIATK